MVKDEGDIIYHTLLHLASEELDGVIIADNLSTDNTLAEIKRAQGYLAESGFQVIILEDNEVGYYQSRKITNMANLAHNEFGADWIIPFDADEIWYYPKSTIADFINGVSDFVTVLSADLYNHYGTALDNISDNPFASIGWRKREKGSFPKVAFRWEDGVVVDQGNHGVLHRNYFALNGLEIRHFPYRSEAQIITKAVNGYNAYRVTDLPESAGNHWRQYGKLIAQYGEAEFIKSVYKNFFWFYSPINNEMIFDPAPFRKWENIKK